MFLFVCLSVCAFISLQVCYRPACPVCQEFTARLLSALLAVVQFVLCVMPLSAGLALIIDCGSELCVCGSVGLCVRVCEFISW